MLIVQHAITATTPDKTTVSKVLRAAGEDPIPTFALLVRNNDTGEWRIAQTFITEKDAKNGLRRHRRNAPGSGIGAVAQLTVTVTQI